MNNTGKMKEMVNDLSLQGLLVNNSLELKTDKNGRRFIAGTLEIDTGNKEDECVVPIDVFTYELKKDGTKNQLFDRMVNAKDYPSVAVVGKANAVSVSISRGRIQDSSFYLEREGRVIEHWRLNAVFIDQASREAERLNVFDIEGVVDTIQEVMDKEGEATGELRVDLLSVGFNESVVKVPVFTSDANAIKYINANLSSGDFFKVRGEVSYKIDKYVQEVESAFGEPIKNERTNTTRRLIIKSGTPPKGADEHGYDHKALLAKVATNKQEIEERFLANRSTTSTSAASNALNF